MKLTRTTALILALLFAVLTAETLVAQNVRFDNRAHTIRIEDGRLYIDGKLVPEDELPETLKIQDVTAKFNFVGNDKAYLDLGGHVYQLTDGRLVEMERTSDAADDVVVYFATGKDGTPVRFRKVDGSGRFMVRSSGDDTYEFYGNALFDQAKKLEELRGRIARQEDTEIDGVLMELSAEAENTARMAEQLPHIQFQHYLRSIEEEDSQLYKQLQREQELELRTRQMAARIRAARSQQEKDRLTAELRQDLEEIFSLKQENRRHEIEQLEIRLRDLEARLKERQELRERIIEARINELLGRQDW